MSMIIDPYRFAPVGASSGLIVEWLEGVEHQGAIAEKLSFSTGAAIVSGVTDAHGRVYQVTSGGVPSRVFHTAQPTPCSVSIRVRVRPTVLATGTIVAFLTSASTPQCSVKFVDDGAFEVMRGGSGDTSIQKSSTGLWSVNNWYWLEFLALVSDTGSYTAKLWDDSLTLLETLSGSADTKNSGTNDVDSLSIGNTANDPYIDNFSVDFSGSLLGPSRVETLYPNAAGDSGFDQWPRTGTDTGANFSQVNEAVKNTTSQVTASAADQFDSYSIDNRSISGTPKALQVNAIADNNGAGSPTFRLLLRIGGVTYEGAITHTVSSSGDFNYWEVWSDNPATGNAWTDSEINSVQIGYRSVTGGGVRVFQCCAEILVSL